MPAKPSSKPKITEPRDLLILGGGLVGMTLALAACALPISSPAMWSTVPILQA